MSLIRPLFIILSSCLLAACGWHLKGSGGLPAELQQVHLDYRQGLTVLNPVVVDEIEARLIRRGAKVTRYPREGASHLVIQRPRNERQTQSVGSDGDEIEFEAITTVTFSLKVDGEDRIPEQTVVARRDYSFDTGQALSKQLEDRRIQEDMEKELADRVMLQLESRLAAR